MRPWRRSLTTCRNFRRTLHSFPARTLTAVWQRLDRLASLRRLVSDAFRSTALENQAKWWALRPFVRQCRDALDDLAFLAPMDSIAGISERMKELQALKRFRRCARLARLYAELTPEPETGLDSGAIAGAWKDPDGIRQLIADGSHRAAEKKLPPSKPCVGSPESLQKLSTTFSFASVSFAGP